MDKLPRGDNLFLRRLARSDLDRTWEWLHRQDIYSKIGVTVPFTKEQQLEWFQRLEQDITKIVFAICKCSDNSHIGNVSLDMIDSRNRNARLSIFVADASARGKGFGSESMELLAQYAFSCLNLHKIWCKTDAGVPRVLNFYKRLGFHREGILKEHECKNEEFIDKVLLAKFNPSRTTVEEQRSCNGL